MKDILIKIYEAASKPSDLKKYKSSERKETVHFKGSDMYDLRDPGYDDEFKYYDASGNGYIKDKDGHVYDVIASEFHGDAGAIAGGSRDYNVTIKKANGTDDFNVHGYSAVFSRGRNEDCIADIKAGYYLEDYIAKYYSEYSHGKKFADLAAKGDKNAQSYIKIKAKKEEDRKQAFDERYAVLPENISWSIEDGKFNFIYWNLTSASVNKLDKEKREYINKYGLPREAEDDPKYKEFVEKISSIQKEFTELIQGILRPVLSARLSEVFKTKDLSKLNGLMGSFVYKRKRVVGKTNSGDACLAIDTKKKSFCVVHNSDKKILDTKVDLEMGDSVKLVKKKASKEMLDLFKKVSEAWKKTEGRKQTEYVSTHWEQIWQSGRGMYAWNPDKYTKGQAKQMAKDEFIKMVNSKNFDKNEALTFSMELVKGYIEGDLNPEESPVEKPLENPEPSGEKKERGKDTKMSKGANAAAYDKMKAWHEGTRKQNLSNCSDAKLKMNYKVCKELGYEKEMKQIEDEAKKRDIVLESISLIEYVNSDHEFEVDE